MPEHYASASWGLSRYFDRTLTLTVLTLGDESFIGHATFEDSGIRLRDAPDSRDSMFIAYCEIDRITIKGDT